MKSMIRFCAVSAVAVAMLGCNAGSGNHDADVAALKANEVQWNADWATHDVDKVASHYTDDAIVMSPGEASSSGMANIKKDFKSFVSDPATVLKFEAKRVEVSSDGSMAATQGTYTMDSKDASGKMEHDHGSYVTTYRKQADGSWKAQLDIATSEVPMPAPAAADSK